MPIDLYYADNSPPCRLVLMVAKALNIQLNLKVVDAMANEHLKPDFVKINPQHCIPTLVDDGFILWESRAIITYLVNKYSKGSNLYPEDPRQRAVVDQRLYFDIDTVYHRFSDYVEPLFYGNKPSDETLKKLPEALELLNIFLEDNQWVAGSTMTLADFAIINTVSYFGVLNVDIFKYPNINAWYERAKSSLPGFSIVEEGIELFEKLLKDFTGKSA